MTTNTPEGSGIVERKVEREYWRGFPIIAYHWEKPSGFDPPSSTDVDCIAYHWSTGPDCAERLVRMDDAESLLATLEARVAAVEAENGRLRGALEPFAKLAGPINGEAGRPTYLEAISGPNGTDEIRLETLVGDGNRYEVMDAEDFRRARQALATPTSSDTGAS